MEYKIVVSSRARRHFVKAIDYYVDISPEIPAKFIHAVESAYKKLSQNPFFVIRYKNVRAIPLKGFPYLLFFYIDEITFEVKILSIFHTSKSPQRYPK